MASLVASNSVISATTGVSITPSGSNRALYAWVTEDVAADQNFTLSFKGSESFTMLVETGGVTGQYCALYRLLNPTTGAGNVVSSGGSADSTLLVAAMQDVDVGGTPNDTPVVVEAGGGTSSSSGAILSGVGDVLLSGLSVNGNTPVGSMLLTGGTRVQALDSAALASSALGYTDGAGANVTHTYATYPGNRRNSIIAVNVNGTGAPAPTITDVDGDDVVTSNQTGVILTGTGINSATLQVNQGLVEMPQSINSQTSTEVDFDVEFDSGVGPHLKFGSATAELINGDAQSATKAITIAVPAGSAFVDLVDPLASSGMRITAIPDLDGDDQLWYYGVVGGVIADVEVFSDGSIAFEPNVEGFWVRAWDAVTMTWGDPAFQTVSAASGSGILGVGKTSVVIGIGIF